MGKSPSGNRFETTGGNPCYGTKNHQNRRGAMQRLRPVRPGVPRGGHRHGERQGKAAAGGLLRRPGGLPARLPGRGRSPCGAREAASVRRGGGGGGKTGKGRGSRRAAARGSQAKRIERKAPPVRRTASRKRRAELRQWPVQIKLAPVKRALFPRGEACWSPRTAPPTPAGISTAGSCAAA